MNDAIAGLRARPKRTIVLAVLLIGMGLTLGLAREAIAYTFDTGYDRGARGFARDGDGYVPESVGDLNGYDYSGRVTLGWTSWYVYVAEPYQETKDRIKYDWAATDHCKIRRYRVADHEKAHSRGWGHGYGTASTNAAYDPIVAQCRPYLSYPV